MVRRYAGKYRRSPYPQATRIKTLNFLRYLPLGGGDVLASLPTTNFLFLLGGQLFLLGEICPPPSSLLRTLDVGSNVAKA